MGIWFPFLMFFFYWRYLLFFCIFRHLCVFCSCQFLFLDLLIPSRPSVIIFLWPCSLFCLQTPAVCFWHQILWPGCRGEICPSRQSRRECKICCQRCKFLHFHSFFVFFLTKTVEIRWNWRCKIFNLKIRGCKILDKFHVWKHEDEDNSYILRRLQFQSRWSIQSYQNSDLYKKEQCAWKHSKS